MAGNEKTIYLGGGCFWCTEAIFRGIKGVTEASPGYMGGTVPNPSYEAVSTGTTGHAEVIRVLFDEDVVSLADIFDVFFATHDPTTADRQGNDVGSQYRSIIFYADAPQREAAMAAIARAQEKAGETSVVTQVAEAGEFYPAEDYHQRYYERHKDAPYCQLVIEPKLKKMKRDFRDKLTNDSFQEGIK